MIVLAWVVICALPFFLAVRSAYLEQQRSDQQLEEIKRCPCEACRRGLKK